jgi:hypothetical protein
MIVPVIWWIETHRRHSGATAGSIGGLECSRVSRRISLAFNCDFFEHKLHSDDAAILRSATAKTQQKRRAE